MTPMARAGSSIRVSAADQAVLREVALVFRRAYRLAQKTTDYVPDYVRLACDAADARYVELRPDA